MSIFLLSKKALSILDSTKDIPLLIVLFLFNSVVEVIGIASIAWFLVFITNPLLQESEIFDFTASLLHTNDIEVVIPIIGGIILIFLLFKSTLSVLTNRLIYNYSFNQGALLRKRLLERYFQLSYEEYLSKPLSDYIQSILNLPVQYSQNILLSIIRIMSEGIIFVAIFGFIFYYDYFAFLLITSIIFFVYYGYSRIFRKKSVLYGKKSNDESKNIISITTESIVGFVDIKLKKVENFFLKKLTNSAFEFSQASAKFEILNTIPRYLIEFSILVFIVVYLISYFIVQSPSANILGVLGVLGAAALRVAPSINLILSSINQIRYGKDTIDILNSILLDERKGFFYKHCPIKNNDKLKSVEIRDLNFSYPSDKSNKIISNTSLVVEFGQVVGIKGKSGSGKSTLVSLILGLLKPTSGCILYHYHATSYDSKECSPSISYSSQVPFLVNDSIENNVALGINQPDIDKIKIALKMAKLDSNVLGNGLKTVGDRGALLSGGQRQRLTIARAFYDNNQLIILDEPTSALDPKTRNYIVNEINTLKDKAIIIVVSHDEMVLSSCDVVYEISEGHISRCDEY